ncbi:MAG: SUMF1/EgtB/PvdO family nonheme iron enzyme, partial [Candidatus Nealsonbacteria bacterium]|nr:SUMF1/EgtB/PvdO family nonheme iron enzyme [Candidatus Nealsonbacteria bacterium]
RMGELIVFDPALGRQQADGAVQRIPGYGKKVEPVIGDRIVNESWPRFLHPYPLSDKYFLVSCQPDADSLWGIYLVDTFDNATLIHQQPGYAMLEPVPLRKTLRPPVLPDQVDLESRMALVYLSDVYAGKGLEGVPRGTVKRLRIYEQHYAYPKMGGHHAVGIDGPWDVKRILGTVPVKEDGSANFLVPANTPLAVQPLDENGRALQIMRSWFTAMPGEILSCAGCHESQNTTPAAKHAVAMRDKPSKIEPWYGPARGFGFKREVQPVLDKYCVGCHDGTKDNRPNFSAAGQPTLVGKKAHRFTPSYVTLHPYVRRPGPESDYFMQKPLEFHAGTSELIQMLEKGHHNVKLDAEAWDRLVTWIDLNVPDHGTWHEHRDIAEDYGRRRLEMRARYANRPEDPEEIVEDDSGRIEFVKPEPLVRREPAEIEVAGWPFDAEEARQRQESVGVPVRATMKLDDEAELVFSLVPPGRFVMGSEDGGFADERPRGKVAVESPFYLGTCEVTNRQYAAFDPMHDSAYISMTSKDHSRRGHPVNGPEQPVVRVTWQQANAFCRWLSARTGKRFRLPTEAEWEWACRAGTDTPFGFGTSETDFGQFANLADQTLKQFALRDSPKWHPRDDRFNDAAMVTTDVGGYQPNAWGLSDMHGNAAEWTASAYRPYAYDPADGRESPQAEGTRTVRGGSWYDRPARATSSFRLPYQPWQRVYNVGFRVVMEVE